MMKKLSFRVLNALLSLVSRAQEKVGGMHYGLNIKLAGERLFKPRADDIFIVSSPKSGTTLMQMMLYQLTSEGTMDFPHIEAVSPWYDIALHQHRADLLEAVPSPRLLKSHGLWERLPRSGRFIYIARNMRDVAISCFHHINLMLGIDHELEEYLDLFLEHDLWFMDIGSWWPHRHDDDVLFLFYDDVIQDLEGTVRKVAKFLNLAVDEEKMPRILECCSLGFMKRHNEKFDPRRGRNLDVPEEQLFRRSLTVGGSSTLTAGQKKRLAGKLQALAEELGWPNDDRDTRGLRLG